MRESLERLAKEIYDMSDTMEAVSVTVESEAGRVEVPLPLGEDDPLPRPPGAFRLVIDVAPHAPPWRKRG